MPEARLCSACPIITVPRQSAQDIMLDAQADAQALHAILIRKAQLTSCQTYRDAETDPLSSMPSKGAC